MPAHLVAASPGNHSHLETLLVNAHDPQPYVVSQAAERRLISRQSTPRQSRTVWQGSAMVQADAQVPVIALRLMEGRTGSTLLMQLLATSPEIVFDDRYPSEYRFLSYFRRLAELATAPFDEQRHRGVTAFFFSDVVEFGPVPFHSDVIDTRATSRSVGRSDVGCVQHRDPPTAPECSLLRGEARRADRRQPSVRCSPAGHRSRTRSTRCAVLDQGIHVIGSGRGRLRCGQGNGHPRIRRAVRRSDQGTTGRHVGSPRLRDPPARAIRRQIADLHRIAGRLQDQRNHHHRLGDHIRQLGYDTT